MSTKMVGIDINEVINHMHLDIYVDLPHLLIVMIVVLIYVDLPHPLIMMIVVLIYVDLPHLLIMMIVLLKLSNAFLCCVDEVIMFYARLLMKTLLSTLSVNGKTSVITNLPPPAIEGFYPTELRTHLLSPCFTKSHKKEIPNL